MNMETINRHWKFHYGDVPPAFQKDFPDVDWQTVSVPHDWSVTMPFDRNCSSGTGYLPGGTAWYRKHFTLPAQAEGGRVGVCAACTAEEMLGVNTPQQLQQVETYLKEVQEA